MFSDTGYRSAVTSRSRPAKPGRCRVRAGRPPRVRSPRQQQVRRERPQSPGEGRAGSVRTRPLGRSSRLTLHPAHSRGSGGTPRSPHASLQIARPSVARTILLLRCRCPSATRRAPAAAPRPALDRGRVCAVRTGLRGKTPQPLRALLSRHLPTLPLPGIAHWNTQIRVRF
jgi:hypothetical protein